MRDYAVLLIVLALGAAALLRPWLGPVALAFVAFAHPQGYAAGFMREFPAFQAVFAAAALGAARVLWLDPRRLRVALDWRVVLVALLWCWFAVTTWKAINPWAAWPKLLAVAKLLPPLLLLLLVVDTRERLQHVLAAVGIAVALPAIKGGYWALMTGFRDRVYGPPGSQFYGNNEFAIAVVMAIPLLLLLREQARDRALRAVLAAVVALCGLAVLTSWSRGALLALGAMTLMLAAGRGRLVQASVIAAAAVAIAVGAFPEAWFARVATLVNPTAEGSAVERLEVWRAGWRFVAGHPVFGGGFEGWIYITSAAGAMRDWHSAYVEMAAEHGLVGLALWLALVAGTLIGLTRRAWQAGRAGDAWARGCATLLRASIAGYAVGALFLGIAYWALLYWLIVCAILLDRVGAEPAPVVSEKLTPRRSTSPAAVA